MDRLVSKDITNGQRKMIDIAKLELHKDKNNIITFVKPEPEPELKDLRIKEQEEKQYEAWAYELFEIRKLLGHIPKDAIHRHRDQK